MARGKPLTVINMISFNGINGEYKPMEECTAEEIQLFRNKVGERMSKSLSDYFSAHPDELDKVFKNDSDKSATA